MRSVSLVVLTFAALTAAPSFADDLSDRLAAAQAAYAAGDLRTTGVELAAANAELSRQKSALLDALLPPAPDGWTQTINTDYAASMAMAGGGTGAEARYDSPDGTYVTVSYLMDSPLMAMMMGAFGNPQMLAMMGKTVEINGVTLIDQDNSVITVLDGRIMVTLNGAETAKLLPIAETIDFAALAAFDAPK